MLTHSTASIDDPEAAPESGTRRRLTLEEWASLDGDVSGELVGGMLTEEEVADWAHENVVLFLGEALRAWARAHGGFVGGSAIKYALSETLGRKPDLSVFLGGREAPPRAGAVWRAPDLMVEVISSSPSDIRRDRIDKMDEYAAFGVRWYWLVDLNARMFEVFERDEHGSYARRIGVVGGTVTAVPGLPALSIDLDALWAEIDALGQPHESKAKPARKSDRHAVRARAPKKRGT